MKLYSGPLSMFGAKAQIAVAEKGAACDTEFVPFSMRTRYEPRHPEVVRINPKRQIPVLIDGDLEIFDSLQIFEYLEDAYTEPSLWPADTKARAAARLLELKSDEVFFPHIVRLMGLVAMRDAPEAVSARNAADAYYNEMEMLLGNGRYLAGAYSFADIAFFMAHYFAVFLGADIEPQQEHLDAWRRRVVGRPAVRSVVDPMSAYLASKGMAPPAFAAAAQAS